MRAKKTLKVREHQILGPYVEVRPYPLSTVGLLQPYVQLCALGVLCVCISHN